jgi:RimJ/RimL family protein N-acetyltransferase
MPDPSSSPAAAPILETPRLRLRAHRIDDYDACAAMWGHPDVARFIGGRPSTAEEAWSRLLRYAGLWALLGFGYWAVERRSDSRFVGDVGFADFRREISPSMEGLPEMGWALAPDLHGQGYASEAVSAALDWCDTRFGASVCIIDPANAASIRVAQKTGFRELANALYRGELTIMYRRERAG